MLEIAYLSDYETTLKMIENYPQLLTDDFWKNKCHKQFENKPYFEFWTGPENYLIQSKKEFTLAISFDDSMNVAPYLYDQILISILQLSRDRIHEGAGYSLPTLMSLNIEAQFIIICQDPNYETYIEKQCESKELAIKYLNANQLTLKNDDTDDDYFTYIIVDLKYLIPWFLKIGSFREPSENNPPINIFKGNTKTFDENNNC